MSQTAIRQLVLLVVLAGVLALGFLVWSRDAVPASGGGTASNSPVISELGRGNDQSVATVKLEQLRSPARTIPGVRRNPFQFRTASAPARSADAAPPRIEEFMPPAPVGPPPPPPIPLRFIGVLEGPTPSARVGIFSDARTPGQGNVFHGKQGDVVEGRYRIVRLGADSADLVYLDGRGQQTLRLSGQ
jgi:hypothetical protein